MSKHAPGPTELLLRREAFACGPFQTQQHVGLDVAIKVVRKQHALLTEMLVALAAIEFSHRVNDKDAIRVARTLALTALAKARKEGRMSPQTEESFTCERCGEECADRSYQPLCPDCHWDEEAKETADATT